MLNKIKCMPALLKKPNSVYEDEYGNFRFRPFDELEQQTAAYYEIAETLYRMLDEPEEKLAQAKREYLKLLSDQAIGKTSDSEVTEAFQALKDAESALSHMETVISDTIESNEPFVDYTELHKQYHDEFVSYVLQQNGLILKEVYEARQEYFAKIMSALEKFDKATYVRSNSGHHLSGLDADESIYYSIISPIPEDIQFCLTDDELKEIKNHGVFKSHEKSFLAES
ncbi:hypothetical protein [Exiguobacterium undae]